MKRFVFITCTLFFAVIAALLTNCSPQEERNDCEIVSDSCIDSLQDACPIHMTLYDSVLMYADTLRPMLDAFEEVESAFSPTAENEVSKARGILQITLIKVLELNRIQDYFNFTWDDAWNVEMSELMFAVDMVRNNPYLEGDRHKRIRKASLLWGGKKAYKSYHDCVEAIYRANLEEF